MTLPDLQAAVDFLEEGDDFLLTSHVDSDWDGIGGCLALKLLLEKLGKNAFIVLHNLPEEFCCFLDGWEHVRTVEELTLSKVDYAIVLDCPSLERIGDVRKHIGETTQILNIDHHQETRPFGAVNLMSTEVSSACEFVHHLVVASGREIDATMAAQLYVGILFDTGGFRYSLTTPTTFEVAAELVRRGARLDFTADQIFNNKSFASVKLIGRAIDSLELHFDGQAAVLHLGYEDLREGSPQDIVNYGLLIRSVEVALLLREVRPGYYRVSLRSRDRVDVGKIAAQLGGGGHVNASGCSLEGSLDCAMKVLLYEVGKALN